MKILMQLAIILFICLLGEVIAAVLPFPFPASVISMLLVLALLLWGPLKIYHIQKQADFLLDNMGFFFVPPTVAILGYLGYMEGKVAIILFICLVTVFTTFAVTSWTVSAMMKYETRRKERSRYANSGESE
ncbi:MAG: CidA/LrgA family protein [Peptococcaceae bacterium]|nr:CidA/LrgA family protein [Peptococcaceae bacterium]